MTIRKEVEWFANLMEIELLANHDKGDVADLSEADIPFLWSELTNHLATLKRHLGTSVDEIEMPHVCLLDAVPREAVIHECADVANFAMMIAYLASRR